MPTYTNAGTFTSNSPRTPALDSSAVIEVLDDLIENARDGERGFQACADEVGSPELRQVFAERAAQCAEAAEELVQLSQGLGGQPDDSGSITGAMHRGWVHVKGALSGDSALAMLEECERGQDAAMARYQQALAANLPMEVRAIVERQARGARANHDQIKALRDRTRAAG